MTQPNDEIQMLVAAKALLHKGSSKSAIALLQKQFQCTKHGARLIVDMAKTFLVDFAGSAWADSHHDVRAEMIDSIHEIIEDMLAYSITLDEALQRAQLLEESLALRYGEHEPPDDVCLEYSSLNQTVTHNGRAYQIEIYRDKNCDEEWDLEIVHEDGGSTLWDGFFATDQAALEKALAEIPLLAREEPS